VSNGVAWKIRG